MERQKEINGFSVLSNRNVVCYLCKKSCTVSIDMLMIDVHPTHVVKLTSFLDLQQKRVMFLKCVYAKNRKCAKCTVSQITTVRPFSFGGKLIIQLPKLIFTVSTSGSDISLAIHDEQGSCSDEADARQ